MTKRLCRTLLLAAAVSAAACDGGPIGAEPPQPGIHTVAGAGSTDTVGAIPPGALSLVIVGADGRPAPDTPVRFESAFAIVDLSYLPTMTFGSERGTPHTISAVDTTDALGRVSVRVRFGYVAGEGKVVVTVPTLGMRDTVRYTVRPGAPVRTRLVPRDTVVYLEGAFTLRASLVDRYGNPRSEVPVLSGSDGVAVSGTTLTVSRFGPHRVRAAFPGALPDSVRVVALPPGRLAAASGFPVNTTLVMMDLDGSNRVTVPLPGLIRGLDWSPDGRVVVAVEARDGGTSSATLYAVSVAGAATPFLVDPAPAGAAYPVFSASGNSLFFAGRAADTDSLDRIWQAKADGTGAGATPIPFDAWYVNSFGPSPDGTRLVYRGRIHDAQGQLRATLSPAYAGNWRWSPLGEMVAFRDNAVVGVMKTDGTGRREFSPRLSLHDRGIDWSGDGKYLVVHSAADFLELVEVATGTHVELRSTRGLSQGALK